MRCTTSDLSLSVATLDSGVSDEMSPVKVAVFEMSARNRIANGELPRNRRARSWEEQRVAAGSPPGRRRPSTPGQNERTGKNEVQRAIK